MNNPKQRDRDYAIILTGWGLITLGLELLILAWLSGGQ